MGEWKCNPSLWIWVPLLLVQVALVFFLGVVNEMGYDIILYLGMGIWFLSIIFGWIPIFTFKKKGGVKKGDSYMKTTKVVDTGIYSILRHPQYTAGQLASIALVLMAQDITVTVMGFIVVVLLYTDMLQADKELIERFGDEYKKYMEKVPRANFLSGAIRSIGRKKE